MLEHETVPASLAVRRLRCNVAARDHVVPVLAVWCRGCGDRVGQRARGRVDRGRVDRGRGDTMHRVKVRVVEDALDANNTIARANRDDFDRHDVTVVNLMSAPGAGKTTLLERALERPLGDGTPRRRARGRRPGRVRRDAHRAAACPRHPDQHRLGVRRRVPPRREHGAHGPAVRAARRDRPAGHRERGQPRLPGRVPRRRGRPRDGLRRSRRARTSRSSTRSCTAPASSC